VLENGERKLNASPALFLASNPPLPTREDRIQTDDNQYRRYGIQARYGPVPKKIERYNHSEQEDSGG
jgi:hypothetical protein